MSKGKRCGDCGGSGTVEVLEYDDDLRMWVPATPVTCGGCNGTGRQ